MPRLGGGLKGGVPKRGQREVPQVVTKGESGLGSGWVPGGRCEGEAPKKGPGGGRGKIKETVFDQSFLRLPNKQVIECSNTLKTSRSPHCPRPQKRKSRGAFLECYLGSLDYSFN